MKAAKILQEVPSLKNTFHQELLQAMESGYVHDDAEWVKEGEKIVGEMNQLEKALNFLRHKYSEVAMEAGFRLHKNTGLHTLKEKADIMAEISTCLSRGEIADMLMWDSFHSRFDGCTDSPLVYYRIRSGHKIIAYNPLDELRALF